MKRKIQTLLIVCAGLLGSGGCNDFFDRNPYDAMPSSKIWASDAYAKNAVNGLYAIANNGDAIQDTAIALPAGDPTDMNISGPIRWKPAS